MHALSLPEERNRSSFVELFFGIFSTSGEGRASIRPSRTDDASHDGDVFLPRRRAQSEILMASGITSDSFGRQESLLSNCSRTSCSPVYNAGRDRPRRPSEGHGRGFDEMDNNSNDILPPSEDSDDDDPDVIFHLSTEEQ